mmetsp:Transcript_126957/g.355567  ORF Transcript_126957/g.355567 Transcript_126957/m.355567 type:complete len:206 (+) Transcript_126957:398-1015(+)
MGEGVSSPSSTASPKQAKPRDGSMATMPQPRRGRKPANLRKRRANATASPLRRCSSTTKSPGAAPAYTRNFTVQGESPLQTSALMENLACRTRIHGTAGAWSRRKSMIALPKKWALRAWRRSVVASSLKSGSEGNNRGCSPGRKSRAQSSSAARMSLKPPPSFRPPMSNEPSNHNFSLRPASGQSPPSMAGSITTPRMASGPSLW